MHKLWNQFTYQLSKRGVNIKGMSYKIGDHTFTAKEHDGKEVVDVQSPSGSRVFGQLRPLMHILDIHKFQSPIAAYKNVSRKYRNHVWDSDKNAGKDPRIDSIMARYESALQIMTNVLNESRFNEIIHRNPSPEKIKRLAATSHNSDNELRFVIDHHDDMYVADSLYYTYHQMNQKAKFVGFIYHNNGNPVWWSSQTETKKHPKIKRLEKFGINFGHNDAEPDNSKPMGIG